MWTFRRNEKDVIKLYDSLSDLMQIATDGNMLNFGYWETGIATPLDAQKNMCEKFAVRSKFSSNQNIVDVGSGLGAPALLWNTKYSSTKISCVNINFKQLKTSKNFSSKNYRNNNLNFLNSTATILPFAKESVDRVVALESAHHFKPLKIFISESFRILKKEGILSFALPIMLENHYTPMLKLGTLSMTWSSEHYSLNFVTSKIKEVGFEILNLEKIGSKVYVPLANFYFENRDLIRQKILQQYPSYVEKILFKSLHKMKKASENNIIDYIFVTCQKP